MLPFGFIENGNGQNQPEQDSEGNIWFEQEWTGNAKL